MFQHVKYSAVWIWIGALVHLCVPLTVQKWQRRSCWDMLRPEKFSFLLATATSNSAISQSLDWFFDMSVQGIHIIFIFLICVINFWHILPRLGKLRVRMSYKNGRVQKTYIEQALVHDCMAVIAGHNWSVLGIWASCPELPRIGWRRLASKAIPPTWKKRCITDIPC